jgi:hypothetical protein
MQPRRAAVGGILFVATFCVFFFSPVHYASDSDYSMLLSESIIARHTIDLNGYAIPRFQPLESSGVNESGYTWQLSLVGDRLLYNRPYGSSVLSLPFVALLKVLGVSPVGPQGGFDEAGEVVVERTVSALLMASLTCIFLWTGLQFLPLSWAATVAAGAALGTPIWSTATRALWSHTWEVFLAGTLIALIVKTEVARRSFPSVLAATLLSWMYFVRPTSSIPALAVAGYVLIKHRKAFPALVVTGAGWLLGFVAWNDWVWGEALPRYYRFVRPFTHPGFFLRFAGVLLSPSHGFLVSVPVVLFVFYLTTRYWLVVENQGLAALALAVSAAHLVLISAWLVWWGGGYGARLCTDLVPWLVLLAILGCRALIDGEPAAPRRRCVAWGIALLILSVGMNAPGALSPAANAWDSTGRLWDLRHPQFLAWILPPAAP